MRQFFKRLFCRHHYQQKSEFHVRPLSWVNGLLLYRECRTCGKITDVTHHE